MARETTDRETQRYEKGTTAGRGKEQETQQAAQGERQREIQTQREGGRQQPVTGAVSRTGRGAALQRGESYPSPFTLMQRMAEDMDRLAGQFGFGRMGLGLSPFLGGGESLGAFPTTGMEEALWSPQLETFKRGDRVVVRADLPGLKKEDVHVEVDNDVLTIHGERRQEREEEREGFYRSERSYGRFHRAIPLPDGVDPEQVQASYADGVLEVTLPAPKQQSRSRKIEIR